MHVHENAYLHMYLCTCACVCEYTCTPIHKRKCLQETYDSSSFSCGDLRSIFRGNKWSTGPLTVLLGKTDPESGLVTLIPWLGAVRRYGNKSRAEEQSVSARRWASTYLVPTALPLDLKTIRKEHRESEKSLFLSLKFRNCCNFIYLHQLQQQHQP